MVGFKQVPKPEVVHAALSFLQSFSPIQREDRVHPPPDRMGYGFLGQDYLYERGLGFWGIVR